MNEEPEAREWWLDERAADAHKQQQRFLARQRLNRNAYRERTRPAGPAPPVIHAVDDPDSTFYVVVHEGRLLLAAHWPQPLERLFPTAVRGPTVRDGGASLALRAGPDEHEVRAWKAVLSTPLVKQA